MPLTLTSKKSAIRSGFLRAGNEDPTQGNRVESVLAGMRRLDEESGLPSARKMPVSMQQLIYVFENLTAEPREGACLWAGLMLGFFFLLRVSNVVAPVGKPYESNYILLRENIRYYTHDKDDRSEVEATAETAGAIRCIAIVVTRSKNDRRPFTREMHRVSHPFLCVVKAVVA
jgi:hypothetical protein